MPMTWTAVYVDNVGAVFSCPITKVGNNFVLATQNGPAPITYYIHGSDLAGGFASFHTYRIDGMPSLRGCDAITLIDKMNQTLPVPQKPADPPSQAEPEDARIHIEPPPAIPTTESSFTRLKAAGSKVAAQYRANRERERQQAQESSRPDPRKVQQARNNNNFMGARMRPKRNTGE